MQKENFKDQGFVLLTTEQAAEYLNLSSKTLERLRCEGGGPAFLKLGRLVRYRIDSLQEWIDSKMYHSTSEYGQK